MAQDRMDQLKVMAREGYAPAIWAEAEIYRLRLALVAIKEATLNGKVCDDVAWFSDIETLHDFCDATLNPK